MKRLVSLLAIALVSSLFAAGCGKLKTCAEATTAEVCKDSSKFENKHCEWKPKAADSKEGTCEDLKATPEAVAACKLGSADKATCETTPAGQDGFKCNFNDKNDPKCEPGFAPKKAADKK